MIDEIIRLQEMLAHQQEEIRRLSDELYAQQSELATLRLEVTRLRQQVKTVADSGIRAPEEETPPPHY